jgi:uncharacterized protein
MLFYLSKFGPEQEKDVHPILGRSRSRATKTPSDEEIRERANKTRELMIQGKSLISQSWILSGDFASRIDRLKKVEKESVFGSYSYEPILLRNVKHLRKPIIMEGTYAAYVCSLLQETEIDSFQIYRNNEYEIHSIENTLDDLKTDLDNISRILNGELKITPNYTRSCRVCEWRNYCKKLVADSRDVTLISGIGKRIKKQLLDYGITDVPSLAKADIKEIRLENLNKKETEYLILQAQSIEEGKEKIRDTLAFPSTKYELFVDIEGSSHHNFVWIVGCLLRKGNEHRYLHFLADSPKKEEQMFRSFLKFLEELDGDFTLYHWSLAEPQYFKSLASKYSIKSKALTSLLHNTFDLFPIFKDKIILPIYTYTLKEVANWLGFEWFDPLVDGATSIILFDKWYLHNDRTALDKAISYNSDDCKALIIIKDYLIKKISK